MELVATLLLLISTEELAARADQRIVVVDTRPLEQYVESHIPGARSLPSEALSEERGGVRGLLKPLDQLAGVLAEAGLDPATPIVLYTTMDSPGDARHATRVFWALEYLDFQQVQILDGGLAKWLAEGRPLAKGVPQKFDAKANVPLLRPREELLTTREEVVEQMRAGDGPIVDMRSPEEYSGLEQADYVSYKGHISGAYNVPLDTLLEAGEHNGIAYYTFKRGEALATELTGTESAPVITYCNTGRSGSVGYFGYRLGGFSNVSLYDGSMAEWSLHPGLKLGN
jgi:thiosulfate/3-mercaptopyruvate sulfurtransferase